MFHSIGLWPCMQCIIMIFFLFFLEICRDDMPLITWGYVCALGINIFLKCLISQYVNKLYIQILTLHLNSLFDGRIVTLRKVLLVELHLSNPKVTLSACLNNQQYLEIQFRQNGVKT